MKNDELQLLLSRLKACNDAVAWVGDKSLSDAWGQCPRADWMLWLVGRMVDKPGWPSRQKLVLAACACAETALLYVPKNEKRPAAVIECARRWARGAATLRELRVVRFAAAAAAAAAADAADDDDADDTAAAYADAAAAARFAAAVAYADADDDDDDTVAAYAAAAVAAAADAADAARAKALAEMADIVRKMLEIPA
jgi:hypothetical protein